MSFHRSQGEALCVDALDAVVAELLAGLERHFDYDRLLITAASAVALLDHVYEGRPIVMRDFDLVLLAERKVTRDWVCEIGEALSSPSLEYLPRHVYTRQRSDPRCPSQPWIAGWGFLFDAAGLEVDLSIYHDAAAHATNGLLDVHRVMVPVSRECGLKATLAKLTSRTPEQAVADGWIEDPWQGYDAWRARTAKVVAWPSIRLEPIQGSIRVVRDFVRKLNRDLLDPDLESRLQRAVALGSPLDTGYLDARSLLKVLNDGRAAVELKVLLKLGVFSDWLDGLGRRLAALDVESLDRLLQVDDPGSPWVEERLVALLEPLTVKDREQVLQAVARPERQLSECVRARLTPVS